MKKIGLGLILSLAGASAAFAHATSLDQLRAQAAASGVDVSLLKGPEPVRVLPPETRDDRFALWKQLPEEERVRLFLELFPYNFKLSAEMETTEVVHVLGLFTKERGDCLRWEKWGNGNLRVCSEWFDYQEYILDNSTIAWEKITKKEYEEALLPVVATPGNIVRVISHWHKAHPEEKTKDE